MKSLEESLKHILKLKKQQNIYTSNFHHLHEQTKLSIINLLFENSNDDVGNHIIIRKVSTICNLFVKGIVEKIDDNNYAFIRLPECGYMHSLCDVYISPNKVSKFHLKTGDEVEGIIKPSKEDDKYLSISNITKINNQSSEVKFVKNSFDNLIPIHPFEKFNLEVSESSKDSYALSRISRIIDLISPIGKGQRGLIVAPPKSGKTIVIKSIANAIMTNHADVCLFVLLVDERPEEVTEMKRFIGSKGEVIASSFDEPSYKHVYLTELLIERAKRLVENKKDVVILLDSLTRLTRAYNLTLPSSGKVLSGGVDSNALNKPKRFFGSARKCENSGSLTIIASALIDTGSKMDEVIFEEFKGTGNLEIVLDRGIAESKIFPAMDIIKSSTRRDEYLLSESDLQKIWLIKKFTATMSNIEAIKILMKRIQSTKNNQDFLKEIKNVT